MKRLILLFCTVLCIAASVHAGSSLSITTDSSSVTYAFAVKELSSFLGSTAVRIHLSTDATLPEGSFFINNDIAGKRIVLAGSDETAMLHAVYTFLEQIGFRFEITGPIAPAVVNPGKLKAGRTLINPFVHQRGIRQHLNFPMDISSYPLEEAKEYVRNVARLRFNCITFHSYPGQWYEVRRKDTTEWAGNFFYGQQYNIPNLPYIREKVRNRAIYCIPAIEPYFNDTAAKSSMAIHWLQELMKECKRAGLTVRFSFEARSASTDVSRTLETARAILAEYPLIDELELMSEETGGWEPPATRAHTEEMLVRHFGQEILNDRTITAPIRDGQPGLDYLYGTIGHNIRALKAITDSLLRPKGLKGCLGLYLAIPEYLPSVWRLMHTFAPGQQYSIMPAHGARKTSLYLPLAGLDKKDFSHTTVYSWIEFDGIMYLQQNALRGIRRTLEYAQDVCGPGNSIKAMSFNHWRTAENRVATRFAAVATLYGLTDEGDFYRDYALGLGIRQTASFTAAMKIIDDADWFATTSLTNVGFCFAGAWGKGFAGFGRLNKDNLKKGREMYQQALDLIQHCAAGVVNKPGRDFLAFLDNRLRSTIVYFRAYEKGTALQAFNKSTDHSPEDKKQIAAICDEAALLFQQYIQVQSALLPDRGCEGTLVSAYHTPIAVLQRIRYEYAGIPYNDPPATGKPIDAPPPPITF
jgi:hypothetical protein